MRVLRNGNKKIDDEENKEKRKREEGKAVRLLCELDLTEVMRWFFYGWEEPTFILLRLA